MRKEKIRNINLICLEPGETVQDFPEYEGIILSLSLPINPSSELILLVDIKKKFTKQVTTIGIIRFNGFLYYEAIIHKLEKFLDRKSIKEELNCFTITFQKLMIEERLNSMIRTKQRKSFF